MSTIKHRWVSTGNHVGVWLHHAGKGHLDGFGAAKVLMVTSPGRRTGVPHSTMVRYLEYDRGYLVWGTGSGSRTEPDWFRNLRQATEASIEIGTRVIEVRPEVLSGTERDRIWRAVVLAQVPGVDRYERKAGREIPVAILRPVAPPELTPPA